MIFSGVKEKWGMFKQKRGFPCVTVLAHQLASTCTATGTVLYRTRRLLHNVQEIPLELC